MYVEVSEAVIACISLANIVFLTTSLLWYLSANRDLKKLRKLETVQLAEAERTIGRLEKELEKERKKTRQLAFYCKVMNFGRRETGKEPAGGKTE